MSIQHLLLCASVNFYTISTSMYLEDFSVQCPANTSAWKANFLISLQSAPQCFDRYSYKEVINQHTGPGIKGKWLRSDIYMIYASQVVTVIKPEFG